MNDKVVYRHLKPCGEVFYIGIGSVRRAYRKVGRNSYWRNIVNKYGYEVQILKEDLSWEDACELECVLIDYYGRRDLGTGTLVNMTNGGEGLQGYKSNKKGVPRTPEEIEAIKKGMPNKPLTEEQRLKQIQNTGRGVNHPNYGKGHLMLGRKHSEETKAKMSGKTIICTETGMKWYTIKSCAEYNNINPNTLKNYLSGRCKNKTTFIYLE